MKVRTLNQKIALLLMLLALGACGGGGGSAEARIGVPPPPGATTCKWSDANSKWDAACLWGA